MTAPTTKQPALDRRLRFGAAKKNSRRRDRARNGSRLLQCHRFSGEEFTLHSWVRAPAHAFELDL